MATTLIAWLIISMPFVLIVWAWGLFRHSNFKRGKAEAYQEVANDFRLMAQVAHMPDLAKRREFRRQAFLRLCFVDRNMCAAVREALEAAEKFWNYQPAEEK